MEHALEEVGRLTDAALIGTVERLVCADRALSAKLLVHLGELDERRLFAGRGYSSMFEYCRGALRMSEAEAYLRIQAARVGRRFPLVVERLATGAVHLTAIKLLSAHLTQDNHVQLLDRVRGRTKREIEVIVAELSPQPDVKAQMRRLPDVRQTTARPSGESQTLASVQTTLRELPAVQEPTPPTCGAAAVDAMASVHTTAEAARPSVSPGTAGAPESVAMQPLAAAEAASFALQSPRARASVAPLGLGRFKLALTLGQEAHDALDQLQALLRHQNPSGDLTRIVERALFELLERTKKQRFALSSAPARRKVRKPKVVGQGQRKGNAEGQSRYIPHEVLRQVHARDAGQCTFVSADGRRCTERGFIQIHHHYTTFVRGGEATVENLRLACSAHNRFWADQDYGSGFVRKKLLERVARPGGSAKSLHL